MPLDPRVQQLIEEVLDSGSSAEEVCRAAPELLSQVREGCRRFRAMEAQIGLLFPESGAGKLGEVTPPFADGLPQVPGYEVEAILGRGGMGIVFKARHVRLKRPVALKMLVAGAYAGSHERARFEREAEAVASLHHANIVQVHDVGEHQGLPYFTMEYVEGGSLAQRLLGTPQAAHPTAALLTMLAEAAHVAHQGGIVHRDLKPANILLAADGTPKIADFGLARHFDAGPVLTYSGARVGTPSYMAPEQVAGKASTIGPATDIYALGAVLYEMLTGRPPFRGETAAETERQVIAAEPVPPARLNPKVPRDLETICLKCLHKDPQRRYSSAGALADDLRQFGDGRPIQARPLSRAERLWRSIRRKPAEAVLAAMALAFVALALGGGLWLERQRAEQQSKKARQEGRASQAAEAALENAAALGKQGRWSEARAALEGALGLLDDSAPNELRERLRQARADAQMVSDLDEIRLRLSDGGRSPETASPSPEKMYADAFQNYGIPLLTLEPAEAAERVRNSSIHQTLLAFLHDWLYWVSDENRARLRDVLDRADDDGWRYTFREALVEQDAGKLSALAHAPAASAQPPVVVSGLGGTMMAHELKNEALAVLREAQERHPEDFWINYLLGLFWYEEYAPSAVGYFRAAVAIRPTSDQAYMMLGRALRDTGDAEGAIAAFRQSVALNPNYPVARDLAWVLARRGEPEEARAAWEQFLERDPLQNDNWYGYAPFCLFLGNEEAYRRARKALLERFGDITDDWIVAERTSLACLLLPDAGDEVRRAVSLADLAVAAGERSTEPGNPYLRFVQGLALYRDGRPDEALPSLREAAEKLHDRAGPRLALAMAQFRSGRAIEARKTLAAAIRSYDWGAPREVRHADPATLWVSHVLRREAEALILPNLPAFLQGDYRPRDNDERVALLGICLSRGRARAAARLFADAFAADPGLSDSMMTECLGRAIQRYRSTADTPAAFNAPCRYLAARCAALAGCGRGKDADKLAEAERARWRKQAREWLRADLAMWATKLESDSQVARKLAKSMLTNWQTEPDLAGVREPHALDDLSADERNDYLALWHEVRALLKRTSQNRTTAGFNPKHTESQGISPAILMRLGRLNEARVAWKSALEADPLEHDAWYGYAELCLFLGDEEEYRRARRALLERFAATSSPFVAERTGRACLLMPAVGDEFRQAVALAERATAKNSGEQFAHPYFVFVRGLADYRQEQFDRAISAMRGDASRVLGPSPALVTAIALYRKGQADEARQTLASAILSYDWTANLVRDQHGCIAHALRREAEALILPKLPAFLDGTYRPQDNDERLALLGVCQCTNRTFAAARLYSEAFAADSNLAEDLSAGHRSKAARAAALAGCGVGLDGAKLSMADRTVWRRQAREWLRADLAECATLLESKSESSRVLVRKVLANWQGHPDLAGLRDAGALNMLSSDERNECVTLWQAVDTVLKRVQEAK
jgi:serine/threonine-protein kinase